MRSMLTTYRSVTRAHRVDDSESLECMQAIDLMTRRLIATGQRPVTVGMFFSLGHST